MGNSGGGEVYLLIALAVAYAPFITAFGAFRGVKGGGVWKFLAFCFCTLAIAASVLVNFVLGVILWLVAWIFAGLTRHSASGNATAEATLKALQEQNALLSKSQPKADREQTKTETERSATEKPFQRELFERGGAWCCVVDGKVFGAWASRDLALSAPLSLWRLRPEVSPPSKVSDMIARMSSKTP